jgi:hypothetical protein
VRAARERSTSSPGSGRSPLTSRHSRAELRPSSGTTRDRRPEQRTACGQTRRDRRETPLANANGRVERHPNAMLRSRRLTPPAGAPPARRKRDAPSEHTVAPALPHRAGWPRRDRRFCGAACCCACHACLTGKAEERIERHTPIAGPQRSRRRPHSGRRPRACCGQARKARSQNLPVSSTIGGDRS